MKIAILGTGTVGTALATALAEAGHEVVFGSREAKTGLAAPVATHADAVAGAELVINATPGGESLAVLEAIGEEALGDRILLDVANASTADFDLVYPNASLAQSIQTRFPALKVVKSLNTMNTSVMTNPAALARETTVFLSGDDADAKRTVGALLADLGWTPDQQLDLGDITTARGPEHYFLLFFPVLRALGTPTFNVAVTR